MERPYLDIQYSFDSDGGINLQITKQKYRREKLSNSADPFVFVASNDVRLASYCQPEWDGYWLYLRGEDADYDNAWVELDSFDDVIRINQAIDEYNKWRASL